MRWELYLHSVVDPRSGISGSVRSGSGLDRNDKKICIIFVIFFLMVKLVFDNRGIYFLWKSLGCFKSNTAVPRCDLKICQLFSWPGWKVGFGSWKEESGSGLNHYLRIHNTALAEGKKNMLSGCQLAILIPNHERENKYWTGTGYHLFDSKPKLNLISPPPPTHEKSFYPIYT